MRCDCGGKFYSLEVRPYKKNGILQRRRYECRKCHKVISVAEVDEKEYKEIKEKITELEIKLYAVRKELKNCYENCFGAVGDHADTGSTFIRLTMMCTFSREKVSCSTPGYISNFPTTRSAFSRARAA